MSYFPTFLNFENKSILIIGGGEIATRKLKQVLSFTSQVTVLCPQLCDKMQTLIQEHNLRYDEKMYEEGDIKGFDIIISAINDIKLQEKVYTESRKFRCLYTCVDLPHCCDFIFPSYIKKGDLLISISTQGTAPSFAKQLRIYIEKLIPSSVIGFLAKMRTYRETMPKGKDRMKFLESKSKEYISTWKTHE